VLGGGFIGLEIAATARMLGKAVTVIESAPRLLARSVSAELAEHVLAAHRASGIDVRVGVAAGGFEVDGERLAALHVDGVREPVELLVLGIGAVPEESLARAAGIHCDNGIVVDQCMRSSDPAVLAIGDCASFPDPRRAGHRLRLESVQNANDQARTAVATLLGRDEPYCALPWFWSEQGPMRLQMVGLAPADGVRLRRPGASPSSFSILHYQGGRLACVESVNAPLTYVRPQAPRRGRSPEPASLDPAFAEGASRRCEARIFGGASVLARAAFACLLYDHRHRKANDKGFLGVRIAGQYWWTLRRGRSRVKEARNEDIVIGVSPRANPGEVDRHCQERVQTHSGRAQDLVHLHEVGGRSAERSEPRRC